MRWRSARTAAARSPAATTGRCGCGTLPPGTRLHTLTGHGGRVAAVAVSADGRRAVSGGSDGTVRVWDLATGKQIASASQRLRHRFARSTRRRMPCPFRSARTAAARSPAATTGRCGCGTLPPVPQVHTLTGHDGGVAGGGGQRGTAAVRSPAAYDGTVRVWDLGSGALVHILTGHRRRGTGGGGQRGRPPRGLRRRRPDGAGVGPGARRGTRLFRIRQRDHCRRRNTARYVHDSRHLNRPGASP